jgi:flagellar basal body-associated protein FliL
MEVSNKGDNKMKGISLQLDILYIILFFLLVAVVIIAFMSLFSNKIKEGLESGSIWQWIENLFKKGLRR